MQWKLSLSQGAKLKCPLMSLARNGTPRRAPRTTLLWKFPTTGQGFPTTFRNGCSSHFSRRRNRARAWDWRFRRKLPTITEDLLCSKARWAKAPISDYICLLHKQSKSCKSAVKSVNKGGTVSYVELCGNTTNVVIRQPTTVNQ